MGKDNRIDMGSKSENIFSEIYNSYHLKLLRVVRYYLNHHLLAEDVLADVFAKLWENRSSLEEIKDIRSYLFVMVKRRCLDEINKSSYNGHEDVMNVSPHILINFKNPETAYLNKELAERIKMSLQKLPNKCRTVFLMVKEDRLRYKEVAELLNISEKTVEMHMGNALKALRKDLESYAMPHRKSKNKSFDRMAMFIVSLL
jgi:RNA polymerase sigma-70 factor (family 1)